MISKIYIYVLLSSIIFIKKNEFNSFFFDLLQSKKQISTLEVDILSAKKLFKEGNYSESLDKALSISKKSTNDKIYIQSNILIADIFEKMNDYHKSTFYLEKAFKCVDKIFLKDSEMSNDVLILFAELLLKIGAIKQKMRENNIAMGYFNKIIAISSLNSKIIKLKAKAYNNLSIISIDNKDLDKAEEYISYSIDINVKLNSRISLTKNYTTLGNINMKKKNYGRAQRLYLKALSYIKDNKTSESMKYKEVLYDNLAWTLYNQKNYKAYDYLYKSVSIADSLRDVEVKKAVAELELKHNVDIVKKEEEVKRLKILGENEKYKRNGWVISIASGFLALLLLYLTSTYKLRQKNLTLELSRTELEKETQLERLKTESQTKILNAAIDGKETERRQIAETLHDHVSALLSSANMHLQASHRRFNGEGLPSELRKTQKIILEASQKIRDLSHDLMSSVLLKFGLEHAIKDIANKYSNSTIQIYTDFDCIGRYNQEDEIKLYNVIQELINNALKHSEAKNMYVILEEKKNQRLKVMIKDDGIGFDLQNFDMKRGIGLNQVRARIKTMKGSFNIDTVIGKGTKVIIEVPFKRKEEVTIS